MAFRPTSLFFSSFFHLLLLLFLLISPPSIFAQTTSFRPKALVLPLARDSSTGQYITQLSQRTPLVPLKLTVDLGGQFLWVDCDDRSYISSSYRPARCRSAVCNLANSRACSQCTDGPKPGCNTNTCALFPDNTITRTSTVGEVATDVVAVQSTDGSNPGRVVSAPRVIFTCGSTFLLEGLAKGVKGMAGLGRSPVGLPSQLASAFSFPRKFAICLGSNGVVFFGDSPYIFLPGRDVSKSLMYTPLFINPVSTAGGFFEGEKSVEYFIGVKSIKVNGRPVSLNSTLLKIFDPEGNGGTKISTVNPYTVLQTSIYRAVTDAFANAFSGVPRVPPVAPFSVCFDSSNLGSTRVGPPAPPIDLVLQSPSVFWRIFGENSMVQVKQNVLCLGFVDGGPNPRTSIVIGAHQIANNLLQFDIARSRLGFSSTLSFLQLSCSNFNFTSKA